LQFRSADQVIIDYDVWGVGAPVMLIHGFASNAQVNWVNTGWVKTLSQAGYQAITFDNRGHGQSGKLYDPSEYDPQAMAEDAKNLADHLNHRRVAVIGYSMGARIAARLTIHHPELISAAVFAGLAATMMTGFSDAERIALALEAETSGETTDATARNYRTFAEQTGGDLKALAACMRASRQAIREEELGRIKAPVLVVAGSEDATAGPVEPLVKAIPNARGIVLPGRDHMKAVGDRMFKDEVIKFLKSVPML
jgi:pimeloyl-ACP methyl ester carboxylesterase